MRAEYEKARRHAENTLAEVNRHLDTGKITNPRHHHMLTDMAEKATRTLENLDKLDNARPYSDTNIGYRSDARGRARTTDDVNNLVNAAMDAVDRIIPHLDDRYSDDLFDDEMDVDDRRGRPRRTRRGVGRYTQVRTHVRRMPRRRSEMDDMRYDEDRYADDGYDDDRYEMDDDVDNRRMPRRGRSGRFIRGDMDRFDEQRIDDDRRMRNDRISRTADTNPMNDRTDRYARNDEARYDARNDSRDEARDARDDAHRPVGPGMR